MGVIKILTLGGAPGSSVGWWNKERWLEACASLGILSTPAGGFRIAASEGVGRRMFMAVPDDLRELLEAGAHFGHQNRRWNPRMKPYLYGSRDGVHIFDLTITAKLLDKACEFVTKCVVEGKTVVFVGTKRQARAIVREEAMKVGAPFVSERWLGGTITNWEEINKRIRRLHELKTKKDAGEFEKYTKKENVLIDREINRLERFVGGIAELKRIPDVLFVVDIIKEKAAVKEARMRGVKVVAMVDSNCDPELVDYVISANDDAVRSIKYIVTRVAEAYGEGKEKSNKQQEMSNRKQETSNKQQEAQPKGGQASSKKQAVSDKK